uniref:Secreted protein n=1 Tax=Heterorhabditis bacteriophora TaxID=37862 RepID=A0A1I7W802_HETBA
MSIRAIFVIIFRSVLAKSKFGHLCKGEYFRRHVDWIPATMACGTEIQVLITSGLFRLLCLHIFTYKHALVYYLLIAEICIYLDERWTSISFSLMFVIYCRWYRYLFNGDVLILTLTISTYYLVVFLEIKN